MKTIIHSALFLYAICIYAPVVNAQSEGKAKKLSFKIYMNGQNEQQPFLLFDKATKFESNGIGTFHSISFGDLSVALQWNANDKFTHEIEWLPLKSNSVEDGILKANSNSEIQLSEYTKTISTSTAAKYQLSYQLTEGKKWSPYLGVSGQISFFGENMLPYTSTSFPTKRTDFDIYFALVPGINISISDHFFADVNIAVGLLNYEMLHSRFDNPSLTEELRTSNNSRTTFAPKKDQFRIGIGYTF